MEWMFLVFTVGALVYGVSIAKEYKEAKVKARAKLVTIAAERQALDAVIQEHEKMASSTNQKLGEVKKTVGELKSVAAEREQAVKSQREAKEQRGKFRV